MISSPTALRNKEFRLALAWAGGTARLMGYDGIIFSAANVGRKYCIPGLFLQPFGGMFKLKVVGDLPLLFSLRFRSERFHHPS